MTEVFFYHGASDKVAAACALLGGAYAQKKPMLVFVPEKELASSIDRYLWTQPALGFVPHCRADAALAAETSILLTDNLDAPAQLDRLMNLDQSAPPNFHRFQRLIEVVGQDDEDRLAARARVKHYKDSGCDVQYFDLSKR